MGALLGAVAETGPDQGRGDAGGIAWRDRLTVSRGTAAERRGECLPCDRVVHDPCDDDIVNARCDRDGEVAVAVDEVRGAVKRVDDPVVSFAGFVYCFYPGSNPLRVESCLY